MKQGRSLTELATELERQKNVKKDYLVPTTRLEMTDDATLRFGDVEVAINNLAHEQIAGHTKIPRQYYDRCLKENKPLAANNVNTWFKMYPATRMVRTLDRVDRAFLSDRFRALDNHDLADAALPQLLDMGVEVLSCDVTETKMYIKVVDQRIKKDLPVGWTNQNRGHGRFDTLSPALVLSNSEVGAGALSVRTSVYFGGCTNLTVIREGAVRKYHVGGKHELGDQVYALLSETTKKLTDATIWSTVKDVVAGAFDRAHFDAVVAKMEDATKQKIDAGVVNEIVEITGDRYGFNENEKSGILRHLIEGGDLSRYGLHNAVTRMSADLDNYDRATQVEELGGDIIELAPNDWKKICEEATA